MGLCALGFFKYQALILSKDYNQRADIQSCCSLGSGELKNVTFFY
ncbi:MAG: hypothetical protein ACOX89_01720 [Lutispora sp.]